MNIDIRIILATVIILLVIDLFLVIQMILNKAKARARREKCNSAAKLFIHQMVKKSDQPIPEIICEGKRYIKDNLKRADDPEQTAKIKPINDLAEKKYIKGLHSVFRMKRMESASNLGFYTTDHAREALEAALKNEKKAPVRLYIANALSDIGDERSIPVLMQSLIGANPWYREKVNMLITDYGGKLLPYLPSYLGRNEMEIKDFLLDFASVYISSDLKQYVFSLIDHMDQDIRSLIDARTCEKQKGVCCNCRWGNTRLSELKRLCKFHGIVTDEDHCRRFRIIFDDQYLIEKQKKLVYKATEIAGKFYFYDFTKEPYLHSGDNVIRNAAVKALAKVNTKDAIIYLKDRLTDETITSSALWAISKLISENPQYINVVTQFFMTEQNPVVREKLAEALSGKIEYFIMNLQTSKRQMASKMIREMLLLGKTSAIIGFLNKNNDIETENDILAIVKKVTAEKPHLEKDFCIYLKERILNKAKFIKCDKAAGNKGQKRDAGMVRSLFTLLILVILIFPLLYLVRHFQTIAEWPLLLQIKTYVIDFNYYLAFYSALINSIYLLLLLFSRINVSKQIRLWNCKSQKMLFKKKMLPGVSIIAPAFNEEKMIIESTNSLLNLTYPDYELIIVNDGSKDDTLNTLIDYYNLKRVDYAYDKKLNTEPIRGVYINSSLPKLIVVDKENGGKADSLNTGIMISNKEYICCIDSDSLLEDDALLKLASQMLDEEVETPALGGNVYPVNGCKVEHGHISGTKIPDNPLARFQTVEYIRAFMAGRLGWAYMNSLMIISGAFGLFRKERVIGIGGYLTSNEKYKKDTVGEDMELVVRISRLMRENKQKYRINYCYNANCWTEVPETLEGLKKQRYRWHRGLIEIIHFHKKTLFNPAYGRMGLISMPYFFLFETAGPIVEVYGYLMVVAALFLGIFNLQIALLLLLTNIMLGVLISIASLIISEKENVYYGYGDMLKLSFYAVIENFGIRQTISFWRVIGSLKIFAKHPGWGTQTRKGFQNK